MAANRGGTLVQALMEKKFIAIPAKI